MANCLIRHDDFRFRCKMIAMLREIFNLWHLVGVKLIKAKITFHDWALKRALNLASREEMGFNP